jgi:hypothetical protein
LLWEQEVVGSNPVTPIGDIMTLPNEWFISMRKNREFLFDLLNPNTTPRVPREVRKKASECLKHFPMKPEIDDLEKMYNNSHKDKNIILAETNKELQRVANEIMLAQNSLSRMSSALQDFVNKP